MHVPSKPLLADGPPSKIAFSASARRPENRPQNPAIRRKTKKAALDLVQSCINPFIINIFLRNPRRKNASFGGKFDLYRAKSAFLGPFRGPVNYPNSPAVLANYGSFFPLDLCPEPA
jgi:hypothetical protein